MTSKKILVIDDSKIIRSMVISLISPLNAEIIEAEDGLEGLELAHEQIPDLVITDMDMPRMNGFALCKELRKSSVTRSIPVIVLSQFDSDKDIEAGFKAGAEAYVSKKVATEELLPTAENVLSNFQFKRDKRILVVDDSVSVRNILEAGLSKAGFQVYEAENGKRALSMLPGLKADLILSDTEMPVMDGLEFCSQIKSDAILAGIPFVVMSTRGERGYIKRLIQNGASTCIVKPFNIHQLVILIEKLLSDQFLFLLKEKEQADAEKKIILASITSLVSALEARDTFTSGHSENVGTILGHMMKILGGSKLEQEEIVMGGQLHDIGKIGVKDSVLLKPGKLTEDEFLHIQQHPVIGAGIIRPIPSLHNIIPMVLHHHERFDGKGYPQGLKGDAIPLWARMTAVADTYDALINNRPYKPPLDRDKTVNYINDIKGTQLCPVCVDVFMQWYEEGADKDSIGRKTDNLLT